MDQIRVSRRGNRRRTALAIAVLGAAFGFTPVHPAAAADDPAPTIAIGAIHPLDLYGPAQDLNVTIAAPPTADAYVRLEFRITDFSLQVTDEAGQVLPMWWGTPPYENDFHEVAVAVTDSDGNGVKGAPLAAGTIPLHVGAQYPAAGRTEVTALLVDGATDQILANSDTPQGPSSLHVAGATVGQSWTNASGGQEPSLPVQVPTGDLRTVVQHLRVRLESAGTRPTPALHLRFVFTDQQFDAAGFTPAQFTAAVRIGTSSDGTHFSPLPWQPLTGDGSVTVDLPALDQAAPGTDASQYVSFQAHWGLDAYLLRGHLQVVDADGRAYLGASENLLFTADQRPAAFQSAFYGRDAAGKLWQYRGNPDVSATNSYYTPRQLVGGGWNTYTDLTALAPLKADGTGNLVGRDHDGVLWFYAGTGDHTRPFAPRVRVGGGWNIYNDLTGADDLTGDGRADLLARDRSGVQWLYKGTGKAASPFAPRVRVGGGWNIYTILTDAGDLNRDGHADLLARDASGVMWLYGGTGKAAAPYAPRTQADRGWQGYTHILGIGNLFANMYTYVLATDAAGNLWAYEGSFFPPEPLDNRGRIGTGWGVYNKLL